MMILKNLKVYPDSCLFLDRDGVINKRIVDGYVTHPDEFIFEEKALEAIKILSNIFKYVVIVTNQQGIGKGIFTQEELELVHKKMLADISKNEGRIDAVFFAPQLASENHADRKPGTGMPSKAKIKFPLINLLHSVMVGDSKSDMQMGRAIGTTNILISESSYIQENLYDYKFKLLFDFANELLSNFEVETQT
jgi:histidinol-phosphate phosphatase family protein